MEEFGGLKIHTLKFLRFIPTMKFTPCYAPVSMVSNYACLPTLFAVLCINKFHLGQPGWCKATLSLIYIFRL